MSKIGLKERLIEQIQQTEDDNILEEVYRLLNLEASDNEVFVLSATEQAEINAARLQIQRGQFIKNKDADKDIEEWLNK